MELITFNMEIDQNVLRSYHPILEGFHPHREHGLDHGIQTQWSPCMVFPKHSGLPAWHVLNIFLGQANLR